MACDNCTEDALMARLTRLDVSDDDILVLDSADDDTVNAIRKALHETLGFRVVLIGLASGTTLQTVNEEAMRRAGWQRVPQ